jgi:hypothetical protein
MSIEDDLKEARRLAKADWGNNPSWMMARLCRAVVHLADAVDALRAQQTEAVDPADLGDFPPMPREYTDVHIRCRCSKCELLEGMNPPQ